MRTTLIACVAASVLALAGVAHAETQTWFGFSVGIRSGSPAPAPIQWRTEPSIVWVGHVAIVDHDACDDDVFRADRYWWRMSNGWWYRSTSWRGPWVSVDVRRVPRPVLELPARRWKHHPRYAPPGQAVREARHERNMDRRQDRRDDRREARRDDRREDRGHGRGGHDRD
jgi:hypothetical protein